MTEKILWKEGESLLFVCFGNTCRSPMAEGLAKKRFAGHARIESAGLSPAFTGAQEEAVAVLKQRYNVDISGHRTRSLADVDLMDFDRIFILDAYVAEAVKARHPQLIDRITVWDIDDPFGRDLTAYENTARLLDYCLDKLRAGGD